MVIDLYFGRRDQLIFRLGESYVWMPNKSIHNGGRPENGDLNGEGYAECLCCHKDFFVVIEVRKDIIVAARPDRSKPPLIPNLPPSD